ncbi:TetR family transcriptional regulator [Actinoplanes philippinensis]|nr:TetR/AcrR family transcriptional regulator [Actinoplanes philippinensis]GIE76350.1 TetR family transcriptional regulator [Actinoplanes philippinensis]
MGRPRGFDEETVTAAAAALFTTRAYDGVGVDDLVRQLEVHRNSLYKTFGSKRGLYLAALRWHVSHVLQPLTQRLRSEKDTARFLDAVIHRGELDLLLLAAVERAPADAEVATVVTSALHLLDEALAETPILPPGRTTAITLSELLGERLRMRVTTASTDQKGNL